MDKEKQEMEMEEESSTSENKITTTVESITPTTSETTTTKYLLNTNDDDTSTESSDTFETWTILNDKEKVKSDEILADTTNRIESLKQSDHEDEDEDSKEEEKDPKSCEETEKQDSFNDDLSDGISIISENESVGRISPHPYIRDHLHDMNLKFSLSDHMDDAILNKMRDELDNELEPIIIQQAQNEDHNYLRQRRKSSSSTLEASNQALQKASQTTIAPVNEGLTPFVRKGIQGIFFVGVALAILALIGKIINPTWQPLAKVSSSRETAELQQKLGDMELQNNLMRAEIDLLNKQVKYLSTLNDPYQQKQQDKYKDYKDKKTFKAWSGNGDTLKPVEITKGDLRRPYKCPDGSFVEIANMCMEKRAKDEPTLVDQFGKVVEDLKEQSEAIKTFEKVAEELQGFQDNPFEQLQTEEAQPEFIKNKPIYQPPQDVNQKLPYKEKYQKQRPKGEDFHSSAPYKQYKQGKYDDVPKFNNEYKNSFGKEFNQGSKEFKSRNNSKERGEWKADKFNNNNNSKERKYRKDNSKERFNKQFDDDDSNENSKENYSKERYNNNNNKQKRKYDKKASNEDFSGEWHTNYMKHRENQRKTHEQKYQDNKNWYIKRGDSREYKRSGEKQYR